jgi:hypothetical protein
MKLISFEGNQIITEFLRQGYFRLAAPVSLRVKTDAGLLAYEFSPGFVTDLRSGSNAINGIIPKWAANNRYNLAIICHDFNYTRMASGHCALSRKEADDLLRQMAVMSGELGSIRAGLMHSALRLFGSSAYDGENKAPYDGIEEFMSFRWHDK